MHTAVVELDALADSVWARAEDHDAGFGPRANPLVLVGGVVVRRQGLELGGARVDRLERWGDTRGQSGPANLALLPAEQVGQLGIGEAQLFRPPPLAAVQLARGAPGVGGGVQPLPLLDHDGHLVEEPGVDPGQFIQLVDRPATAERLGHLEQAIGCSLPDRGP